MKTFFTTIDDKGFTNIFMQDKEMVWAIPADPSNADYQEYLRSLEPQD
jgi:hypothetical protein